MDATASISSKLKRKATKAASSPDKNQLETSRKRMRVCHRPTFDISVRTAEIQKLCEKYHLAAEILEIETDFTDRLMSVDYGEKVTHVYNPVDYAYKPHIEFYRKFCKSSATVLLIGENPGPFGGAQTGVGCSKVFCDLLVSNMLLLYLFHDISFSWTVIQKLKPMCKIVLILCFSGAVW